MVPTWSQNIPDTRAAILCWRCNALCSVDQTVELLGLNLQTSITSTAQAQLSITAFHPLFKTLMPNSSGKLILEPLMNKKRNKFWPVLRSRCFASLLGGVGGWKLRPGPGSQVQAFAKKVDNYPPCRKHRCPERLKKVTGDDQSLVPQQVINQLRSWTDSELPSIFIQSPLFPQL